MESVICPECKREVPEGNFCSKCGAKLRDVCKCWVLKKPHHCGMAKCPGTKLLEAEEPPLDTLKGALKEIGDGDFKVKPTTTRPKLFKPTI